MFKFNHDTPFSKFDAIVLTFEKGEECWNEDSQTKSFHTAGDFDRFSVTPTPLPKDQDINTSGEFFHRYKKVLKKRNNASEKTAYHYLFGLATMTGSEKFWENGEGNDALYTFVSLVQLGQGFHNYNESLKSINDYLKKKRVMSNNGFDFLIYSSLDACDIFLFVKSNDKVLARTVVLNMTRTLQGAFYSYTHMGFDPVRLLDSTEILEKVTICASIRDPALFADWIEKWKIKYPKEGMVKPYERVGYIDFNMNIYGISMGSIAHEMHDGLLAYEKKYIENTFRGYKKIITRPHVFLDSAFETSDAYPLVKRSKDSIVTLLDKYNEICDEFSIKDENHIEHYMRDCMKYALKEMFKSIGLLEKKFFAQDVIYCIKASFNNFIRDLKKQNEMIRVAKYSDKLLEVNRLNLHIFLQAYLDANMSLINGSLQSDKMFFQVPGFSVVLFDVHPKLVLFYLAFTRLVSELLNEDNTDFGVVLDVGLHYQMNVEAVFSIDNNPASFSKDALLVLKIPMASQFVPHNLLPQLIHEIAHIRSTQYACYDERRKRIIYALSDIMTDWLFVASDITPINKPENVKNAYRYLFPNNKVLEDTVRYISEKIIILMNRHNAHFSSKTPEKAFNDSLIVFFGSNNLDAFLPELCQYIQDIRKPEPEDMDEFMIMLNVFVQVIYAKARMVHEKMLPTRDLCTLMEESYSDFIMLKISAITGEEYLKLFSKTINRFFGDTEEFEKNLLPDFTLQRIHAVFISHYGKDATSFLDEYLESHKDDVEGRLRVLSNRMKKALKGRSELHEIIVHNTVAYLSACNRKWDSIYADENKKISLNHVRDVFQKAAYAESIEEYWNNLLNTNMNFIRYVDENYSNSTDIKETTNRPKVAFVCVHNSCRSQLAEALGKHHAGNVFESYSAGIEVKGRINQIAVRLMKDMYGIDMELSQYPKLMSEIPDADYVVTMGCNVNCPVLPHQHHIDWGLNAPTVKDDEAYKILISQIEAKILELMTAIKGNRQWEQL